MEFKRGAFVLARQAGVPIVPIGIIGTREVMAKGSLWVRPGTVRVRVGETIDVSDPSYDDEARLAEIARDRVAGLLRQPPGREGASGGNDARDAG